MFRVSLTRQISDAIGGNHVLVNVSVMAQRVGAYDTYSDFLYVI